MRATDQKEKSTVNADQTIAPSTPISDAASGILQEHFGSVAELLSKLRKRGRAPARLVHHLRVATRRAASALLLVESCLGKGKTRKAKRALRRVRQAAGELRQVHVHADIIRQRREASSRHGELDVVQTLINRQVQRSQQCLLQFVNDFNSNKFKRIARKLIFRVHESRDRVTVADAAINAVAQQSACLIDQSADLTSVENLHQLRIAGKRTRYLLEIVETAFGRRATSVREDLEHLQSRLGAINDLEELAQRIELAAAQDQPEPTCRSPAAEFYKDENGLGDVAHEFRQESVALQREFLNWWKGGGAEGLRRSISGFVAPGACNDAPADLPAITEAPPRLTHESEARFKAAATGGPWPKRIAAIDVGTNSIRLVIAEVHADRRIRIIDDERAVTRLGRGLAKTGELARNSASESILALQQFKAIASGYGVDLMRAVATCAVREGRNGLDFVKRVKREAGVDLQVISPQAEAKLAFASVSNAFNLHGTRTAVIDLGGGSTEIIFGSDHLIEQIYSLPVGAIRVTENFKLHDNIPPDRYRRMRQFIKNMLAEKVGRPPFVPHQAVGTGGTFTTLAAMSLQRGAVAKANDFLPFNVRGYEMQRSEIKHILDQLRELSLSGRVRIPGLGAERADIIVAGLSIIDLVLKHLQVNTLRIHDQGIRGGLLQSMVNELLPASEPSASLQPVDRMRAVRQFAVACNFEQEHSDQVARLALSIFDQLGPELGDGAASWATAENREMLHAAALLHDIGYFINYSRHHKHSYHLVMHSDLPGFTHRQREIIANICRYHRGGEPKKSHANIANLRGGDRALVRMLAAILRLADGLDRSHTSSVQSLEFRCHEQAAFVRLVTHRDATVDIWGAMRKSALFERVFGLKVRFSCASDDHPSIDLARAHSDVIQSPQRRRQSRANDSATPSASANVS